MEICVDKTDSANRLVHILGWLTIAIAVAPPSIADTAVIGAVPMALAALAVALFGPETRKRQLEEITAEQLGARETKSALAS